MEDSLKGLLVTLTIIGLFTTSILSYVVIFPQEQGVNFEDLQSNDAYLTVRDDTDLNIQTSLSNIKNSSQNALDEWDITQGFMGSNTIKQGASANVNDYNSNIFSVLILIATKLFGGNSAIVYAIGVLFTLSAGVIIYMVIKFVRQGQ